MENNLLPDNLNAKLLIDRHFFVAGHRGEEKKEGVLKSFGFLGMRRLARLNFTLYHFSDFFLEYV